MEVPCRDAGRLVFSVGDALADFPGAGGRCCSAADTRPGRRADVRRRGSAPVSSRRSVPASRSQVAFIWDAPGYSAIPSTALASTVAIPADRQPPRHLARPGYGAGGRARSWSPERLISYPARRWRADGLSWPITVAVLLGDLPGLTARGRRRQHRRRAGGCCGYTGKVPPGYRSPGRRLRISADRRGRGKGHARRRGCWWGHPAARRECLVPGSAGPRTGSGG